MFFVQPAAVTASFSVQLSLHLTRAILFLFPLGKVKSVRQNRCQSWVPLHNGASRERPQASSYLAAGAHQNRFAVKGHKERENPRDSDVSGQFRDVQNTRQLLRGMPRALTKTRQSLQRVWRVFWLWIISNSIKRRRTWASKSKLLSFKFYDEWLSSSSSSSCVRCETKSILFSHPSQ